MYRLAQVAPASDDPGADLLLEAQDCIDARAYAEADELLHKVLALDLRHLDALAAVYPDAVVVRLHRDPAETIPSACRLTETIRRARSDRVDPREIGRFWLSLTTSSLAARTPPGLAVLDVRYPDLLRDPVAVLARVCEFAGVPSTGAARRTMTAYLAEHPAGSHGVNRYRAGDFGLSPDDLHHRFAAYRRAHGL